MELDELIIICNIHNHQPQKLNVQITKCSVSYNNNC